MARRAQKLRKTVHTAEQKAFSELLTAARRRADLNQQEVADLLGKPQSFVAKYENGDRRLDVIEFVAIAGVLKCDPVKLLGQLIRKIG